MKKTLIIAKKEFYSLLNQPVGYVFSGLLLMVTTWMFFGDFFLLGQAEIGGMISTLFFLFSLFIPAVSMGMIAEEKKNGNWELLSTLPINLWSIVTGKFLGALVYIMLTIILTVPITLLVMLIGKPEIGMIMGGYISLILVAASYLIVGIISSALSNSPIVAFLISAVFLIINNLMGQESLLDRLPGDIKGLIMQLSISGKFDAMATGLVSIRDLIFFASWILMGLIITVTILKSKEK